MFIPDLPLRQWFWIVGRVNCWARLTEQVIMKEMQGYGYLTHTSDAASLCRLMEYYVIVG